MTTPAALRELADRLAEEITDSKRYGASEWYAGYRAALEMCSSSLKAATQLRTAASEGGEAVAYLHYVAGDDGEPDQALSFTADTFPLEGVAGYRKVSCQPLYAHPITSPNEAGNAVAWVDENELRRFVNGTGGPFLHAGVENALRSVPLYTHPPEVARDAADAERWRTLRDSLPREYNHDKDKGYIRWYLPRARGGFMGLQEHIDSIISSKAASSDAALRARAVG